MLDLILLVVVVYWIGKDLGDRAGMIALAIAIVIVLSIFGRAWRRSDRAYGNFVEYWAEGGDRRAHKEK